MPVYAIKWIGSGLYFDGFGELASLIHAKTFSDWKDCPLDVQIGKQIYKLKMKHPPGGTLLFYVLNETSYLRVVKLSDNERKAKDNG